MKMIWHDLDKTAFAALPLKADEDMAENSRSVIISNNGGIKHCIGCFGCWIKTPGVCVMSDECPAIGQALSRCRELVIISKCVYGSYSPFIRRIWDRSISYLLPFFVRKNTITRHQHRYANHFSLTVYFYGENSAEEQETAEMLVTVNGMGYNADPVGIHFYRGVDELTDGLKDALQ
ncbi:MAG: flavodoxin family protein [Treponema sp.]|nr:flavodoxin family protein [Treponema sp.]